MSAVRRCPTASASLVVPRRVGPGLGRTTSAAVASSTSKRMTTTRRWLCANAASSPSADSSGAAGNKNDRAELRKRAEARVGNINPQGNTIRFYKKGGVNIEGIEVAGEKGWCITLDGRPMRTPRDNRLVVPTRALAIGVALEWEAQKKQIQPTSMPLMTLAATTLDVVAEKRTKVIDVLLSYLKTDSTTCRVTEDKDLSRKQDELFDPLHQWFSQEFNVPPPPVSRTIFAESVSEETLTTIQWLLFDLSDWELTGLESVAHSAKSLVVALAVWKKAITTKEAMKITVFEESHQRVNWGDEGGMDQQMSDADLRVKVLTGATFLHMLQDTSA